MLMLQLLVLLLLSLCCGIHLQLRFLMLTVCLPSISFRLCFTKRTCCLNYGEVLDAAVTEVSCCRVVAGRRP